MRAAHQGVPVAGLPTSRGGAGGFLSNFFQTASSQSSVAPQPARAPQPPRPIAPDNGYRQPPPRTSSPPPSPTARPESAAGLDGWLVDRLFGGGR
jgi:penicillin-binding protein 1A